MRATLIVPALFALSLVGGSALAEKPGQDHPIREPKMDVVRDRGDVVDRYDHASVAMPAMDRASRATQTSQPSGHAIDKLDAPRSHGDVVDHEYSSGAATTKSAAQRYSSALPYTHTPQATQKQQERQNCSTAQDDCAANRANKFAGTHDAHLVKTSKSDAKASYAWKSEDPSKAKGASKAPAAGLASLSQTQQASLGKLLKAKMCAHAASQDGCGGGSDD